MSTTKRPAATQADPFAMMLDPEAVLRAVERSERLQRLQRRVCRPLDKPLIPHAPTEVELFDRSIDDAGFEDPSDEAGASASLS
ncbi:MAG: hypothetical protein RL456_3518 [Pseudomonadota bacterium]|jgi:hypothetical protein